MRVSWKNNEQGIALTMVVFILTVVTILGLSIITLSMNNVKMSSGERSSQASYYIAESGINYKMDEIYKELDAINKEASAEVFFQHVEEQLKLNEIDMYTDFEKSFNNQPKAEVKVVKVKKSNANSSNDRDYKIISKGVIGNRSRTAEKKFSVDFTQNSSVNLPNTALFVNKNIDLLGGAYIDGATGINSSSQGAIRLDGGAKITGDIFVGPNAKDDIIDKPAYMNIPNKIVKLNEIKTFHMPVFPEYPTYPMISDAQFIKNQWNKYEVIKKGSIYINNWMVNNFTLDMKENLQLDKIIVDQDYTLNINIGNSNRSMVINEMNMPQGKINIIGTGKLTIFVKNNITLGGGAEINSPKNPQSVKEKIKQLDIYYKGTNLTMSGAQKIYGSLFAERANITMTGGSGFQGSIVTGGTEVNINGGTNALTQIFYAPNAAVNLSGGGKIVGSIVANSFTGTGGGFVKYEKFHDVEDLPPFLGSSKGTISIQTQPTREK